MDYKVYYVGEKPGGAMTINVLDQDTGLPANVGLFTEARMIMLDTDNREVDLGNGYTEISEGAAGRVVFVWPTDKSLFTKPGEYMFQLELSTPGSALVKTSVQDIVVKRMGGRR